MSSTVDHIRKQLLGHEELAQWPDFVELVNRPVRDGGISVLGVCRSGLPGGGR